MKILQVSCILVAITVIAICQPLIAKRLIVTPPSAAAETEIRTSALPNTQASAETTAPPVAETVVPAVTVRRVSSVPVVIPLGCVFAARIGI